MDAIAGETWSTRSEFWLVQNLSTPRLRKRERAKAPLVLAGHGIAMTVEGGALKIRNGRTHYPQLPEAYRFFPGSNEIPPRIIILDGSGYVSLDVLEWLAVQGIPLIRLNWKGDVITVAGGDGYVTNAAKVEWQRATRADPAQRLSFCKSLIRQKLEASVQTLREAIPGSAAQRSAITSAELGIQQLGTAKDLTDVRGIEALCASVYFAAWRGLPIRIAPARRRAIPDAWHRFEARSSIANGRKVKNANASDPVNAMLNYAYGVLQAQMQIRAVADGCDPSIGIMHHGYRGNPAYVFDIMEPERPRVDSAILALVAKHDFSSADFTLRSDGVVRLSPQLARTVCSIVRA
jgi:CRISP-associated protein Cas1